MALFKPTYRDPQTGEMLRSGIWWIEFSIAGKRIRESTKTTRKTIAKEYLDRRKRELEQAYAGMPADEPRMRIRTVRELLSSYVTAYSLNHRPHSVACVRSALKPVKAHLGGHLVCDLTEERMQEFMRTRLSEGVGGRAVNLEIGELSRAIGRTWKTLWPRLRKLEERHDVGRALSNDEERRLINAVDRCHSPNLKTLIRVALLTGARAGELTSLRWGQIDFEDRTITIGVAKTQKGTGRMIPMNEELFQTFSGHAMWFAQKFGEAQPGLHVFPYGSPVPHDATRPTVEIKTAWNAVRRAAGVECRWHDLRHTAATKLAESGVSEETFKALFGWMSTRLIERYSHVRVEAKRRAMEGVRLATGSALPSSPPKVSPKVDAAVRPN